MSKILVVDDSGYARRVHRGILEAAGHTVLEAAISAGARRFLPKPANAEQLISTVGAVTAEAQ